MKNSLVFAIRIGHPIATIPSNPCIPTPCGPNSNCHVVNELSVCSCLPNYIGRAPNCRPECMTNSECARNLACVNERCIDPCIGTCGAYATCIVYNHQAVCRCPDEFTGDPFSACSPIPSKCSVGSEVCKHGASNVHRKLVLALNSSIRRGFLRNYNNTVIWLFWNTILQTFVCKVLAVSPSSVTKPLKIL